MDRARLRLKAILMAKVKMAGSYKAQAKTQVKQGIKRIRIYRVSRQAMAMTPKQGKKPAMKNGTSAMDIAKNNWIKSLRKQRKIKLSAMEAALPKPPAGTSTARKLQDPDHVDLVKAMVNVPSAKEMGLGVKGESIYDKMLMATTRQLSASTGAQYSRHWQRWLQWKDEYLEGNSEGGSTAAEAAVYLTYLAYSSGGMGAVKMANSAFKFYARLQGPEGNFISDPLINTVIKGLERDFSKPVKQKEGFTPVEIRQLVQHLLKEKICPKLKDLRLACLILVMYIGATRFEEAAAIELANITTLETGNLMIRLRKGKTNQLAKNQDVILPKLDTGEGQEMDVTVQLKKYTEQLEFQGGTTRFLFPSLKADVQSKKVVRLWKLDKAISYDSTRKALLNVVKAAKIKIKMQDGVFGLHSFRVGALTAAANTGLFTPMQLQNMGRWAQLDSAARYFLPREKEKMKVGMELGNQLAKAMKEEVLEAAGSRKVACNMAASKIKAAAKAGEMNQVKIAKKRALSLEKQEKVVKCAEKKEKKERLLLVLKRTGQPSKQ